MKKTTAALAVMLLAGAAQAQTVAEPPSPGNVIERSSEYRYQLDLHVNPAALAKMLPAGWESTPAATGPAKDCNLRLIFIDRVNIVGPDGKALGAGTDRLAYLAAPVKQTSGAEAGQMILGGISENDPDAAGTFGILVKASQAKMVRGASDTNGAVTVNEEWSLTAASGEHMQIHVKYVRGPAARAGGEVKFYNPANPAQLRIFRTEQATDVARNVTTTPPDRVLEFSFSAGGGRIAALFDGSEKPLSWDSQPTYVRAIIAP